MDAGDVYRQLAPAVLGYLRGQRVPEPDDLLGEVFLQVARSLPRFRGDETRTCADGCSRSPGTGSSTTPGGGRAVAELGRTGPASEDAAPADDEPIDPDLLRRWRLLTPEQREVVALRFIADLSLEDVARITGRTTGAVKAMQARGLASLARILEPDLER